MKSFLSLVYVSIIFSSSVIAGVDDSIGVVSVPDSAATSSSIVADDLLCPPSATVEDDVDPYAIEAPPEDYVMPNETCPVIIYSAAGCPIHIPRLVEENNLHLVNLTDLGCEAEDYWRVPHFDCAPTIKSHGDYNVLVYGLMNQHLLDTFAMQIKGGAWDGLWNVIVHCDNATTEERLTYLYTKSNTTGARLVKPEPVPDIQVGQPLAKFAMVGAVAISAALDRPNFGLRQTGYRGITVGTMKATPPTPESPASPSSPSPLPNPIESQSLSLGGQFGVSSDTRTEEEEQARLALTKLNFGQVPAARKSGKTAGERARSRGRLAAMMVGGRMLSDTDKVDEEKKETQKHS